MKDREVVNLLLNKEIEINNLFHAAIGEIMRLGYETDRGRKQISDLINSVEYSISDMRMLI